MQTRRVAQDLAGTDQACHACGYNLRNATEVFCPECGVVIASPVKTGGQKATGDQQSGRGEGAGVGVGAGGVIRWPAWVVWWWVSNLVVSITAMLTASWFLTADAPAGNSSSGNSAVPVATYLLASVPIMTSVLSLPRVLFAKWLGMAGTRPGTIGLVAGSAFALGAWVMLAFR